LEGVRRERQGSPRATGVAAAVDKWAEDHDANRSEAIRRLIEIGLKAKTKG
jgi:hypothetical protein